MKIKYFSIIIFIFILYTSSFGQGLKFGFGGGLSTISNDNSGLSYNAGYHLSAKAKIEIPLIPIKPVAFIQYYVLNGSYTYASPAGNLSVNASQKIFSFGFGGEIALIPGPISPYLALDFGYNNIGEVKFDTPVSTQSLTSSISRTGLDIGAGIELTIPFFLTFDVNAKYNMLNLFGKQGGEGAINALNLNLSVLF
jgi:hypothetical protein